VCGFSSSAVNLTLPGFLKTRLLSLHPPRVTLQHFEVLERTSSSHIEGLDSSREGRNTGFALTGCSTAPHLNVYVKQARVGRDSKRLQNTVPLRRKMEVLDERLSIDRNSSSACPHVYGGRGRLTFAKAPSFSLGVKFSLALLLGKGPAEVKQVDTVKLREVVWVYGAGIACG